MASSAQLGRRGLLLGRSARAQIPDDRPPAAARPPVAAIARSCLAFHGVACMSCRDACPTGAIRFSLVRGGAVPRVESEACTGCADCAPVCPAAAIAVAAPAAGGIADA
ncbi:4Fe-4S dicluster domain-containing protein (plasmid) [Roseomonas sp. OT10]|uniref:4Fe-4S dicluster domain-containing protein n=1 Tax=Roseomonas cutis TaxID=2897332 RepID=UPI001E4BA619|nr:4Fe-4S dicluster domain-containing protein [Roseomonas sp. OT10]UFN51633.1 4Fe-4S dicluster domain-containing protein [Roseomonas sp. OT10]